MGEVVIDQQKTWAMVEARLAVETDPLLRRNLETVLAHMKAEAAGDLDGLLATLADDCHYHLYNGTSEAISPRGKTGVRRFYEDFIASGATRLMHDVDCLVVDRNCVVTDGVMRMAYPGRTLAAMGIDVDDPEAFFLYEARMVVLWPMDGNGLLRGEDTYTGSDGFAGIAGRKLSDSDIAA